TRAQVASYFNPLRLSDTITSPKGLKALQPGEQSRKGLQDPKKAKENDNTEKSKKADSSQGDLGNQGQDKSKADISAEELFSDPYGVLAKLASQAKSSKSGYAEKKGAAFRDPFDPNFRRSYGEPSKERSVVKKKSDKGDKPGNVLAQNPNVEKTVPSWTPKITKPDEKPVNDKVALKDKDKDKDKDKNKDQDKDKDKDGKLLDAKAKAEAEAKQQQEKSVARLREAVKTIAAGKDGKTPEVELRTVSEGTLISLTDSANFAMFRSASVVPVPQVVKFFEELGEVIAKETGKIVIAGHTDARPFRSSRYDNWRLSTDRAHIAYHMLVRGGIPAERIVRVEGHAARRPRIVEDPKAAANRRVEILIRRPNKP
ncbi:MAG: OmpA family protein, partial [Pseudomonadota bacterium]